MLIRFSPMKKVVLLLVARILFVNNPTFCQVYTGSGSVTQGLATTINTNLFPGCAGSRVTSVGTITSSDSKVWIVPAQTNFTSGPYLPDLYNQCSNVVPPNLNAVNLNSLPVTVIDNSGDTIIAYLFGDNYFELYINGVLVGVDPVPYTPFNSCIVKFKVSRPYTIAVKLVDWEENLGIGTENNNNNPYHAGDGGFIAKFSDGVVTDNTWLAQTYYIAPLGNPNDVIELSDSTRSTAGVSTSPACNANCYGVHFNEPVGWNLPLFNDVHWPLASIYSAATVGVNFPAYQNFSSVWSNAKFIWSSNLVLDNLVLLRKTVNIGTGFHQNENDHSIRIVNPFNEKISITSSSKIDKAVICLQDFSGKTIKKWNEINLNKNETFELIINDELPNGLYMLTILYGNELISTKLIRN